MEFVLFSRPLGCTEWWVVLEPERRGGNPLRQVNRLAFPCVQATQDSARLAADVFDRVFVALRDVTQRAPGQRLGPVAAVRTEQRNVKLAPGFRSARFGVCLLRIQSFAEGSQKAYRDRHPAARIFRGCLFADRQQ